MTPNKDCSICVYDTVCPTYRRDGSQTDCCVPEMPLRQRQALAIRLGVEEYAHTTHTYVNGIKAKSKYWNKNDE
jgi:hypothetical protein